MERHQVLVIPGNPELLTFPFWARLESWGIRVRVWRQLWNKWEHSQERPNWRGNVGDFQQLELKMDHRATISSGIRMTGWWQYHGKYFLCPAMPRQVLEHFSSWRVLEFAWIKKGGNTLYPSVEFYKEAKDAPESWKIMGLVFKKWQVGWFL